MLQNWVSRQTRFWLVWIAYSDQKLTGVPSRCVHCIATDNINIQEGACRRCHFCQPMWLCEQKFDISWREYCYHGNRCPRVTRQSAVLFVCLLISSVIIFTIVATILIVAVCFPRLTWLLRIAVRPVEPGRWDR